MSFLRCTGFDAQYGTAVGEAIGILLGDIVFAWAYECLMTYTQQYSATSERVQKEFATLVSEVTHGQILDVLSPVQAPLSKEDIIQKMILKTARYSFVQPIALGYAARGIPRDTFVDSFGIALGIGFQLQDDLLDVVSSTQSGKTSFVDMQAGQQTLLSWYMRSVATESDRILFEAHVGTKDMSDEEKEKCATLLDSAGATTYVREQIKEYFANAQQMVDLHKQSDKHRWQEIIDSVAGRKK
jgi:geranylgeranyl pyrophosphate synthase